MGEDVAVVGVVVQGLTRKIPTIGVHLVAGNFLEAVLHLKRQILEKLQKDVVVAMVDLVELSVVVAEVGLVMVIQLMVNGLAESLIAEAELVAALN